MEKDNIWLSNPEYMELVEFLVEKTKDVKEVLNVKRLIRKFKKQIKSPLKYEGLRKRIQRFRLIIHEFAQFDTETKVKLMFGLSGPVDEDFLGELRNEAEITVDRLNRITHYKKNGGGLELNGIHRIRDPTVSIDQILEFMAEKVEESGVFSVADLRTHFKETTGRYQQKYSLQKQFHEAKNQIYGSGLFDEEMKVKMMFATKAMVPGYALKKLRKKAIVVVDGLNRIKEYRKNDGSLNLGKDDSEDSDEEVEEKHGDSSDDSDREANATLSDEYDEQSDMGYCSFLDESRNRKRRTLEQINGSVGKKKKNEIQEITSEYDYYPFDFSYQSNDNTEVKLERFNGTLKMDLSRGAVINDGDDFVEELPASTGSLLVPKYEEMLMDIKMEGSDVKKDHTPLNLVLESFHDFIDILDLPILSDLQKKIEAKLEECNEKMVWKDRKMVYYYLELCLVEVNNNWESNESMESFRLESFLSPFRLAVVHMKCPFLVKFQQKLKGIIGELRGQNKFVPITSIQSALEGVIDNIINS